MLFSIHINVKPLVWQNIKDDIIKQLEEHKDKRLEEEYCRAQASRKLLLSDCLEKLKSSTPLRDRIFPPLRDLLLMEPFVTLISAPASEQVEFPASLLSEASQSLRNSKEIELRDMVIRRSDVDSNDVDVLRLAATIFQCSGTWWCKMILGYPEVLGHESQRSGHHPMTFLFHDKAHTLANVILEASGLDPATTTRDELYRRGFYIECHNCTLFKCANGERTLFTWHAAINHALEHDEMGQGLHMARVELDSVELERVQKLENQRLTESPDVSCVRCKEPRFIRSWYLLSRHIIEKHQDEREPGELLREVDFDFEITATGFRPEPRSGLLLKPRKE
ncbi:hypothetical protein C0991_009844 [Blastosporella zonata]|nr:hypothetical protein C0991_009844 [Blastosporella zonata]